MIVDVLLVVALAAMAVLAVGITLRARRDHLDGNADTATDTDQP